MAEKRRNKRYGRRLRVLYGEKDFSSASYTRDISRGGAFVVAQKLPAIGTRLHVQVHAEKDWVCFEGEVRWHKSVPAPMRHVEQGGFGVRFFRPEEIMEVLIPQLRGEKRFELFFTSLDDLKKSYDRELKFGGAFIRTEVALARETEVTLELRLEFLQRTLEIPGKVLQLIAANPQTGLAAGVAITFQDKDAALKAIAPFLGP